MLLYDKDTGVFTWRVSRSQYARAGGVAGTRHSSGAIYIIIYQRSYRAHRLAWLYVYGYVPTYEIDHKNGKPWQNWILNLREATHSQNCRNRKMQSNNTTGFRGVYRMRNKFQARIKHEGRFLHLGTFATPEEASDVYVKAAQKLHAEFIHESNI